MEKCDIMRILLLSSNSPFKQRNGSSVGGAEISLRLIAEELVKRGHSVYYLTRGPFSFLTGMDVENGVNVSYYPGIHIPFMGRLYESINDFNVAINEFLLRRCLKRMCIKEKIEIIHSYATFPDTFSALKVGNGLNIPVCQRIAGKATIDIYRNPPYNMKKVEWTRKNIRYMVPISEYLMDQIMESRNIFRNDLKIKEVDIGIEIPRKVRKTKKGDNDEFLFLSVSSFKGYAKRQDIILKAVKILSNRTKRFRVDFIGGGMRLEEMKRIAEYLGVEKYVRFLGSRSREEVMENLSRTDVFIHASDHEGLGKAVMEAMANGIPIIASNVKAINDYIENGKTGILVENNPEAFAERMFQAIKNRDKYEEIGKRAYEFALLNFDPEGKIEQYEKIFEEIIEVSRKG